MTKGRERGTVGHMVATPSRIPFIKMHGLGNDFVVFSELDGQTLPVTPELARSICDRRFGVGADQVLWLRRALEPKAIARMEILNADGSVAEMCGNGIRAVGLFLYERNPAISEFMIETLAGLKVVSVDPEKNSVRVAMGVPNVGIEESIKLPNGVEVRFVAVSVGNPHAVVFAQDVDGIDVANLGPLIENHPRFPRRTNVEFVEVRGGSSLRMRVWERGAGVTLACGTGACASVAAARASKRVSKERLQVSLDGGLLEVSWAGEGNQVFLEGPAEETFRGTWVISSASRASQ